MAGVNLGSEWRRRVLRPLTLVALCLMPGLLHAQASAGTATGDDHCDATPPPIVPAAESYEYHPPSPGLRFYAGDLAFSQVVSVDGPIVQASGIEHNPAYWMDGISQLHGRTVAATSTLKNFWPIHQGVKKSYRETWGTDTWLHEVEVGDADTLTFDGRQIPIVWIEEKVTPEKATAGPVVLISEAYAPTYGFPLVRNARTLAGAPPAGASFAVLHAARCGAMVGELSDAAMQSMREAVKRSDHQAEFELAMALLTGPPASRDQFTGNALLQRAAQSGLAEAQARFGMQTWKYGTPAANPQGAAEWLQKASDQDQYDARFSLGSLYFGGQGIPADRPRGLALVQSAADHNVAFAQFFLGQVYMTGNGAPADLPKGLSLLRKAADQGVGLAMMQLGFAYRDGTGVKPDQVAAYAWLDAASGATPVGNLTQQTVTARDNLAILLLPDELLKAQRLSRHWHPGAEIGSVAPIADASTPAQPKTTSVEAMAHPVKTPEATADSQHPVVQRVLTYDIDVAANASKTMVVHSEMEARNEAALSLIGQASLHFGQTYETIEVLDAYTLKADGRKLPVNVSAIYEQLVPGAPNVPMFDDQRQKVIVFPNVEIGDVVIYTAKFAEKPLLPGLFSFRYIFPRSLRQDDVRITIHAPKSLPLYNEEHEVSFTKRTDKDGVVYEWRFANPTPIDEDILGLSPLDRLPRLFVSSYADYEQFGHAYAAFVAPKRVVSPRLAALADEITQGITDRRKQAEAIYYWVGRHIRYVGVELGQDAFVPHEAQVIFDNGYGDCKDHATLFSTLLAAKQIDSEEVLINFGNSYALARPPTFGNLNHAITWLPEFGLYADTTAGVAPFGVLPFPEYGKPVVHAVQTGPTLHRTPLLPPGGTSFSTSTRSKMAENGTISGTTQVSASGSFSVSLRQAATRLQSQGANEIAAQILRSSGYEGSGRFDPVSPYDIGDTFTISGHFDLNPNPQYLTGTSFYLPRGLSLGVNPGDELMGSFALLRLSKDEPTACYSGHEMLDQSLELPSGLSPREVPKGASVKTPMLSYASSWSFKDHVISVHREFTSAIDAPICLGKTREDTAAALKTIASDYATAISLVRTEAGAAKSPKL